MDVVRGQDLITLAPTALNNSFVVVVTQFGFRRNYSLPAPKTGGLFVVKLNWYLFRRWFWRRQVGRFNPLPFSGLKTIEVV
jgi:hypothetical protein